MTAEQREHIAAAIGIMDMGAAILRNNDYTDAADIMVTQCEILQEVLDKDRKLANTERRAGGNCTDGA